MRIGAALLLFILISPIARADDVFLVNGDRLSGTVTQPAPDKVVVESPLYGKITLDSAVVRRIQTPDQHEAEQSADLAANGAVATSQPGPATSPSTTLPARPADLDMWKGSVTLGATMTRGNTHTENLTLDAAAAKRREDDRTTLL